MMVPPCPFPLLTCFTYTVVLKHLLSLPTMLRKQRKVLLSSIVRASQQHQDWVTKKVIFAIHSRNSRPKPNPCGSISLRLWQYWHPCVFSQHSSFQSLLPSWILVVCIASICGMLVYCLYILVELQVPLPFLENNTAFQEYISRGLLNSFVGLEQAYSARIEDVVKHASSTKLHCLLCRLVHGLLWWLLDYSYVESFAWSSCETICRRIINSIWKNTIEQNLLKKSNVH